MMTVQCKSLLLIEINSNESKKKSDKREIGLFPKYTTLTYDFYK